MEAIEFGKYIKQLRTSKKMTIRQLELYSGVSNAYISQIERGLRGIPSPEILEKLSKPLGVNYEELMNNAGYIERSSSTADLINSFLIQIADNYNLTEEDIRNAGGPPLTGEVLSMKELLLEMSLEDKLEWFMTLTDNLRNVAYVSGPEGTGRLDFVVKPVKIDLEDNDILDVMDLTYKGMPLTKSEKSEFLSIARAIFDARRALKGKD